MWEKSLFQKINFQLCWKLVQLFKYMVCFFLYNNNKLNYPTQLIWMMFQDWMKRTNSTRNTSVPVKNNWNTLVHHPGMKSSHPQLSQSLYWPRCHQLFLDHQGAPELIEGRRTTAANIKSWLLLLHHAAK